MRATGVFAACVFVLAASSAASASVNLLRNGDFETGTAFGWTPWRAPWGQQEQYIFNDRMPGRSGKYNLKITAYGSSFGVYQEVAVVPGKYYRIEALWKATLMGEKNWFEIELLQGPWNYELADLRPGDIPHKMYSYDLPETTPITFDWTPTPTLDGTPVDIHQYRGVRQAAGTKLTVVLKAGGNPDFRSGQSVVSWFDDVALYEVPEPSTLLIAGVGAVLAGKGRISRLPRRPENG